MPASSHLLPSLETRLFSAVEKGNNINLIGCHTKPERGGKGQATPPPQIKIVSGTIVKRCILNSLLFLHHKTMENWVDLEFCMHMCSRRIVFDLGGD